MPANLLGVTLDDLNFYTRDLPDSQRGITLDSIPDVMFYDAYSAGINKDGFDAANSIEHLIQTTLPLGGKSHGEGADIPQGRGTGYIPLKVPLAELIDNIRISRQAMIRAKGMPGSWGKVVDDRIEQLKKYSFKELLGYSAIGPGNGWLARVYSATVQATRYVRIVCDNTCDEAFVDNVHWCKPGLMVEITASDGVTQTGATWAASTYEITSVVKQKRNNGASSTMQGALATGYIDVDCLTGGAATTLAAAMADNDIIWRAGAVSDQIGSEDTNRVGFSYPRGVAYWFMNKFAGLDPGGTYYTKYFGLLRATYASLQPKLYNASGVGADGDIGLDTRTAATPDMWSLRGLSDVMVDIETGGGGGQIDTWMFNKRMGMAINSRNSSEKGFQVIMPNTDSYEGQTVALQTVPQKVVYGDRIIRMICDEAVPSNTIVMADSRDDIMDQLGSFDFLSLDGGAWSKSFNDRLTDFEAPYGGFCQFRSTRLDNKAVVQDLRDDI